MDIRYVYPSAATLAAVRKVLNVGPAFGLSRLEDFFSLVSRLHDALGRRVLDGLPTILKISGAGPEKGSSLAEWLHWLEHTYIQQEPRTLSPGAMSNAPDRLDGFHSFNRCCRSTADTGRSAKNLRSYTTDRRVFEYWAAGDWIAADRMMGEVRSKLAAEPCANGHSGPCQADHIGPISLGFNHHAHFRLLCAACNSSKNNRMSLADVSWLRVHEAAGHDVISWHSRRVWDICKDRVVDDEHALRLSKLLRDNRHSLMAALARLAAAGHHAMLASLLELEHADFSVKFDGLQVRDGVTGWQRQNRLPRATKYAAEQKARRSRVAFTELFTYFSQENRNAYVIKTERSELLMQRVLTELASLSQQSSVFDDALRSATAAPAAEMDGAFRAIYSSGLQPRPETFAKARALLTDHMSAVGERLSEMWDDERFRRASHAA